MKSHTQTQSVSPGSDSTSSQENHSHASKHMLMMAVCCGLPILGFLAIGTLGIAVPGLETLLLLACPIGMGFMMYSMQKNGKSCCTSEQSDTQTISEQDSSKKTKSCCH